MLSDVVAHLEQRLKCSWCTTAVVTKTLGLAELEAVVSLLLRHLLVSGQFHPGLLHNCLDGESMQVNGCTRFWHEYVFSGRCGAHLSMSENAWRAPLECSLSISPRGPWTAPPVSLRPSLRPRPPLGFWICLSTFPSFELDFHKVIERSPGER